jgi:hypothetical protein
VHGNKGDISIERDRERNLEGEIKERGTERQQ